MSKRRKLRDLVRLHPDWTNQQYADYLGQRVDTIRGALSVMGLSRNKNKKPKTKTKIRKPAPKLEPRHNVCVVSRSVSYRTGYIKLI